MLGDIKTTVSAPYRLKASGSGWQGIGDYSVRRLSGGLLFHGRGRSAATGSLCRGAIARTLSYTRHEVYLDACHVNVRASGYLPIIKLASNQATGNNGEVLAKAG